MSNKLIVDLPEKMKSDFRDHVVKQGKTMKEVVVKLIEKELKKAK